MLALQGSNRLVLAVTVLLLLTAVAAFPCAASAMSNSDSPVETVAELDEQPAIEFGRVQGTLLDRNPEIGPLVVAIIAGVVSGLIVAAVTNPSTTAAIVQDAVSFVADAYESYGETCVNSPGSC
ncbi:MAG: hypothetical protein OXH38_06890 [Chloroflexi bacterium]|nr:hypothetical protein [Chloroflexota bacterium]